MSNGAAFGLPDVPPLYEIKETAGGHAKLAFNLHAGQTKAWNSTKRWVVVCAGTQSGKTSFGPLWLYREIQQRGPGDYLVATPTFPLLALKLLPEFLRFFEKTLELGTYKQNPVKVFTFSEAGQQRMFGRHGGQYATQVFFGHAQDPDSLESATAKGAWLDEAGQRKFKKGSWQAIQRRLSLNRARALITTTPYEAFGWLKSDLHDPYLAGDPDIDFINFRSIDNPAFSREEYERARRAMPDWKFKLFYDGLLTRPAGLILDCWQDRFIYDPEETQIRDYWPRFLGIDFGGVNTAAVYLAEDPATGLLYLYREYKAGHKTIQQHATDLLRGHELRQFERVTGGAPGEQQWRDDHAAAGLPIEKPPIAEVEVGIQRAYALIKKGRLRVSRNCTNFLREITTYRRKLDDEENPTDEIDQKNKFHHMDAFRYIAAYIEHDTANLAETI